MNTRRVGALALTLVLAAIPASAQDARVEAARREGKVVWYTSHALSSSERRSEEHTSELQSPCNLVCRLLLEKKKKKAKDHLSLCHATQHPQHSTNIRVE